MIKIEDFKKEHSTNMKRLNEYLNDDLMGPIAEWIMQEKGNPYVWMDPNYYNQMRTLGGFISILHNIHHALVDDGEMCFPIVEGEQQLRFMDKWDYIRTIGEPDAWAEDIYDFIENIEIIHREWLRNAFAFEASSKGVAETIKEYVARYPDFDPSWATDIIMMKSIHIKNKMREKLKSINERKAKNNDTQV